MQRTSDDWGTTLTVSLYRMNISVDGAACPPPDVPTARDEFGEVGLVTVR